MLHAFGTREDAESEAAKWRKDGRIELSVASVRGQALLDWLSRIDLMFVNGVEISTAQKATSFLEQVNAAKATAPRYALPRSREHQATSKTTSKGVYHLGEGGFLAHGRTRNLETGHIVELVVVSPDETRAARAGVSLRQYLRQLEWGDE